jgi:hypothetical protein
LALEDQYKGKNVDLLVLSERIARFFSEKEFTVAKQEKDEKHVIIVAAPKPFHGITDKIEVDIYGTPNDFSVKFVSGSRSNDLVRYGRWASLIAGGYFLLKGLRSQEELEKLERRFWIYVDETVWYLSEKKAS